MRGLMFASSLCALFASCCVLGCGVDQAVIGSTGSAVLGGPMVMEPVTAPPSDAGVAPTFPPAPEPPLCTQDDECAPGEQCDPVLRDCVSCADGHCSHISAPAVTWW